MNAFIHRNLSKLPRFKAGHLIHLETKSIPLRMLNIPLSDFLPTPATYDLCGSTAGCIRFQRSASKSLSLLRKYTADSIT